MPESRFPLKEIMQAAPDPDASMTVIMGYSNCLENLAMSLEQARTHQEKANVLEETLKGEVSVLDLIYSSLFTFQPSRSSWTSEIPFHGFYRLWTPSLTCTMEMYTLR